MTNDELLRPRYKVIADYPGNKYYPVGKIITILDGNRPINDNGYRVQRCDFDEFPYLFKKLQWWEERKEEDMPEYLKDEHSEVFRVENYSKGDYVSLYKNNGDPTFAMGSHSLYELIPANPEEYENQNR